MIGLFGHLLAGYIFYPFRLQARSPFGAVMMQTQAGQRLPFGFPLNSRGHASHFSNLSSAKLHKCTRCNYSSVNIHNFKRHLTTHDASKRYACKICHKSYVNTYNLRIHMQFSHSSNDESTTETSIQDPTTENSNQDFTTEK